MQELGKKWDALQKSKRVIIHIPSLGHSQQLRFSISEIEQRQNLQMARLCDIKGTHTSLLQQHCLTISSTIHKVNSVRLSEAPLARAMLAQRRPIIPFWNQDDDRI